MLCNQKRELRGDPVVLAAHARHGERGSQYRFVRLSALQGAKAELYMAFLASGMRKAELARRLGIPKTNVDRLCRVKSIVTWEGELDRKSTRLNSSHLGTSYAV